MKMNEPILSRRYFLKTAGSAAVAVTGFQTISNGAVSLPSGDKVKSTLFNGKPSDLRTRIERVKTATLGMQRYDWEQGAVAQAFMEMGETDLAISFARGAILRQVNGRFSVIKNNGPITDCASIGEVVLEAWKKTGDPIFKNGADEMMKVFKLSDHKTPEGIIYHSQEPTKWIMSDANYMLPPFLAAAGEFKEAVKQIEGFRHYLYHPEYQLYSHIWDDEKKKFKREDFWGVGNGWSAAGITRVVKLLPERMISEKKKLIGYVKELLDSCLKYLRPDGLFHDVINKPDSFVEVNLSQMLSYTIFRGIKAGYLDPGYVEKAELMRKAANDKVDVLGYVHDVCGLPNFDRSYFAPEGQAFYLLMETAAKDFYRK
jgi:rhamnogalacturonyl hydrolase YesR